MRKTVIILILLSFSFISKAQIIISDVINWQPVQSYTLKNGEKIEKFYFLSFQRAIYQDAYLLPYYTKIIDLPNDAQAKPQILQAKFIQYKSPHKLLANGIIPSKIKISAQVYQAHGKYKLIVKILPVKKLNNVIYLLWSFKVKIVLLPKHKQAMAVKFAASSVMSSGHWVKIAIPSTGIYRISYDTLRALGFADPAKVRVFGNDFGQLPYYNYQYAPDDLEENTVLHKDNFLYFFAKGANVWYYDNSQKMFFLKEHDYTDTAYYFLSDVNTGFDNAVAISQEPTTFNTTTDYYVWYAFRGYALHNYLRSGREWFDLDYYYNTKRNFDFKADSILPMLARVRVVFMGRGYIPNSFSISVGNYSTSINIPPISGLHGTDYGKIATGYLDFTPEAGNRVLVAVNYNGRSSSSRGALDNITVNAKRRLIYDGQTIFANTDVTGAGKVTKFILRNPPQDLIIWDITDPVHPKGMSYHIDGTDAWFIASTDSLREFIAFSPSDALLPITHGKFLGPIANQNLHALPASTQMIIITHPDFISGAEKIAQLHRQHDNMNVAVVTTEQVYNEYSSGLPDAVAIRNFIRSVYVKPGSQLKWVLLFGDGSFKNKPDKNNPNFIPTYQTLNSLNTNGILTIETDDFFGLLDNNEGETHGLLDVNIGRIPVQTPAQAELIAFKIDKYLNGEKKSIWKSNISVVADDGEQNLFMEQLENVTNNMENTYPQFITKKMYIDEYPSQISFGGEQFPQAVSDITNSIEQGTLVLAYNGHGNEQVLSSERVITSSDVRNWHNMNNLTLMVTATCLFGHFDNYDYVHKKDLPSGVEYGLFNPYGGLIASYATTRASYTITNYYMLNYFFKNLFAVNNGKKITISEAITRTKELYPSYYNREFLLMGDPALSLDFPETSIDSLSVSPDTIHALSKVRIKGCITDNNGNVNNSFNGTITIKVFDKPGYYYTLNNDGFGAFKYLDYKNILYSGQITVRNGKFDFSFISPKDIEPDYGIGKIIYYATDGNSEYMGYKFLKVGGQSDTTIKDVQGPKIRIFLNDTTLTGPTITDRNPKVIIYLSDQTGINTTDYGLGHQIQLILDNSQTYNLNGYFTYDKDKSNQGRVEYKLCKLSPGKHSITVKAFDVLNNYSEKTIEFTVTDQKNLVVNRVFNYPNPFTTSTNFYFEHNQVDKPMYVSLQIFTMSGKLVKQFNQTMVCNSFLSDPIHWDGLDEYGGKIARGVYVYILTVKLHSGETVKKVGKLLKI